MAQLCLFPMPTAGGSDPTGASSPAFAPPDLNKSRDSLDRESVGPTGGGLPMGIRITLTHEQHEGNRWWQRFTRRSIAIALAATVVMLAAGGVATYLWVDYSQAQNSLTRARLEVRSLGESLDLRPEDVARLKPEEVARLKERYSLADIQVKWLETCNSMWIDKGEISAMRTALGQDKQDIDQLAAAADKRRSSGTFGGWIHPSPQ